MSTDKRRVGSYKIGLKGKLLAIFLFVFVVAITVFSYFSYQANERIIFNENLLRIVVVAKSAAAQAQYFYKNKNTEGFKTTLQSFVESEELLYIVAYDSKQDVWLESSTIDLQPQNIKFYSESMENIVAPWFWKEAGVATGYRVINYVTPIFDTSAPSFTPLGWVRLGFSTEHLEKGLGQTLYDSLFFGTLILIVGSIIFILLASWILRIIKPLIKATQQVAEGNLAVEVPITSNDELGQLANSFNLMTQNMKREHGELVTAKAYTDNIIASIIDALIVFNQVGTIRTVNRATCLLLGYGEQDLVGEPISKIIVIATEASAKPATEVVSFSGTGLEKLLQEGSVRDLELVYKTKTGDKIPMSFSGSVMHDKESRFAGIVGVAKDLRKLK